MKPWASVSLLPGVKRMWFAGRLKGLDVARAHNASSERRRLAISAPQHNARADLQGGIAYDVTDAAVQMGGRVVDVLWSLMLIRSGVLGESSLAIPAGQRANMSPQACLAPPRPENPGRKSAAPNDPPVQTALKFCLLTTYGVQQTVR